MVKHARPAIVSIHHACFPGSKGNNCCAECRKWPTVVGALVLGMPYCQPRSDEIPRSSSICINRSKENDQRRNDRLLPASATRYHAESATKSERCRGYCCVYPRNAKIGFVTGTGCARVRNALGTAITKEGNSRTLFPTCS